MANSASFTFETSGLSETVKQTLDLAKAQKELQAFLNLTAKAFIAQGQGILQAKESAKALAQQNNITAQSIAQLNARQAEVAKGAKAIADTVKSRIAIEKEQQAVLKERLATEQKASDEALRAAKQQESAQIRLITAFKANQSAVDNITKSFGNNSVAASQAVAAYQRLEKSGASAVNIQQALQRQLGVTGEQFKIIEQNVKKAQSSFDVFKNVVQGIAQGLGQELFRGIKTVLTDLPADVIKTTAEFERLKTALDFATGGKDQGAEALKFVREEVDRLKIPLQDAIKNFSQLSAATKGTVLEGEGAKDAFSAAAQAARVLGLSADDTSGIFRAFTQIISKGKVQAEELRGQIGDRLPGAVQIFARALGVSTTELDSLLKKGEVGLPEFQKFVQQLAKETAEGVPEAVKTATAAYTDFQNKLQEITVAFGSEILPALTQFLTGLTETSGGLEEFAKSAGQNVAAVLDLIGKGFKFASDNSALLNAALQILVASFAAIKLQAFVSSLVALGTAATGTAVTMGGLAGGLQAAQLAAAGLQATIVPLLPLLLAVGGAVAVANVYQYVQSLKDANDALEVLYTTSAAQSQAALQLANSTKNLNDELKNKTKLTAEEERQAQLQINTNKQSLKGLQERLQAAKSENAVTEEQKNAKATLIAELENEIRVLGGQTKALSNTVTQIKASNQARALNKGEIKDETKSLKEQNKELIDNAKNQEAANEKKLARAKEDQDIAAKRALEDQIDLLKEKQAIEEQSLKASQKKETDKVQATNERAVQAAELDFERNVKLPLQQENARKVKEAEADFERSVIAPIKAQNQAEINAKQAVFDKGQAAFKAAEEAKIRQAEAAFNKQQNAEKAAFEKQLKNEADTANKGFDQEQKQIDRQLQLEQTKSFAERARLEQQFRQEDQLQSRREQLESGLNQKRKAFQEQQDAQRQAFEDAQNQKKLDFETNVLNPLKATLEEQLNAKKQEFETNVLAPLKQQLEDQINAKKLEFEQNTLTPLKQQLEDQIQAKRLAFETNVLQPLKEQLEDKLNSVKAKQEQELAALKEKYEDQIKAKQRAFEDAQRVRDRAFEDAKEQRKIQFENNLKALQKKGAEEIEDLKDKRTNDRIEKEKQALEDAANNQPTEPKPKIRVKGGRKDGGNVQGGSAYLVGEQAPEIFIPGQSGTILNPEQARKNLELLYKVSGYSGKTPKIVNSNSLKSGNPYAEMNQKLTELTEIVKGKKAEVTVPVTFQQSDLDSRQLDRLLKVQRSVVRSMIM